MPVIGFSTVIAFVVIGIVLIEVGYWVQNFPFSRDFRHTYISDTISEQPKNLSHYVGGRRVDNKAVSVVQGFQIPEWSVTAEVHSCLCALSVRRLGLGGRLPCVIGIDDVSKWQQEVIYTTFCVAIYSTSLSAIHNTINPFQ